MAKVSETRHAGCFMVSEASGHRSREQIIIGKSQTIKAGQLLARAEATDAGVTVSRAAGAGNTGNGVMTLATPAYDATVKPGRYRVTIVEPVTNLGTFTVEDPEGVEVGTGVVGTAYTGPVKFTIADGSTDFVAGDTWEVLVEYTAAEIAVAFDQDVAATAEPFGIAWDDYTTTADAYGSGTAIVRDAEVRGSDLTVPSDITADEKIILFRDLKDKLNIVVR